MDKPKKKYNGVVNVLENIDLIEKMLSEGYSQREIWIYLVKKKKTFMGYRSFHQIINKNRKK